MVVDDTTGLQMGVDRNRTHIFQPSLFQVAADPVRQAVSGWDISFLVAHVKICFPLGEVPDVITERAKLGPYFLKALGMWITASTFLRERIIPSVPMMRSMSVSP